MSRKESISNYSRGADFERRVKKHYEKKGFLVVRSAGSHSPVDLIALKAGEVILIQAKSDRGHISRLAREQLIELAVENRCQAQIAYRDGRKLVLQDAFRKF